MRHTESSLRAALAFLAATEDQLCWGYQLQKITGLRSGVLYPIMRRWVREGWVWQRWEDGENALDEARAPRRYTSFTYDGREAMTRWVTEVIGDRRFAHLFVHEGEATTVPLETSEPDPHLRKLLYS